MHGLNALAAALGAVTPPATAGDWIGISVSAPNPTPVAVFGSRLGTPFNNANPVSTPPSVVLPVNSLSTPTTPPANAVSPAFAPPSDAVHAIVDDVPIEKYTIPAAAHTCPPMTDPGCVPPKQARYQADANGCTFMVCVDPTPAPDAAVLVPTPSLVATPALVTTPSNPLPSIVLPVDPSQYVPSSNPACDSVNADAATAAAAGCVLYGNTNTGDVGTLTPAVITPDMTPWLWLGGGLLIFMLMRRK